VFKRKDLDSINRQLRLEETKARLEKCRSWVLSGLTVNEKGEEVTCSRGWVEEQDGIPLIEEQERWAVGWFYSLMEEDCDE